MDESLRNKTITVIDRTALFFFAVLVFFLPISNAAIESSFGFIFLCFLIKLFLVRPPLEKIKDFFSNRINLSLLIFYICILFSIFASGPLWKNSLKAWFFKWGEGVLLFYFAQVFLKRKYVMILLYTFLASSLLVCIDGVYQRITGMGFIRGFPMTDSGLFLAVRATFSHYNGFATYLVAG